MGFEFLGGLFAGVGVDPEAEILSALLEVVEAPLIPLIVGLVVLLLTVVSILGAFSVGGKLGLLAVALAWISGFIVVMGDGWAIGGVFVLIFAIIIGGMAPASKS